MLTTPKLDARVERLLETNTVSGAQRIMQSRSGMLVLALISFIESALPLPILTDPFLVAAIMMNRARTVWFIVITIGASIVGGVVAYFSALYLFELLHYVMTDGMLAEFQRLVATNESNTFVLTIVGAVTPIPYTLVAWAVAVLQGSVWVFIGASILGRSVRYLIAGYCAYRFGPLAVKYARRYLGLTSLLILLLAVAYVWYKM